MSKGIRLSEKHGLNPSILKCFFCGGEKGIALMGRLKGDAEAPRECVMDYEPCDKCKWMFSQGVLLIGVTDYQPADGRPPMTAQGNHVVYPTGGHAVIKDEAAAKVFSHFNRVFKPGDTVFVDQVVLEQIISLAAE